MERSFNIKWIFILLIPFLIYHNNGPVGPDNGVYLNVAHSIVFKGSLNTLPQALSNNKIYQITKTNHAPIHQNVGGVLFILPATVFAVASHYCAQLISNLPSRLYDFQFHEGMWVCSIAYLLAIASCVLIYRVARCYHRESAVITALAASALGGPLLIYSVIYPCQTNLPAAFLASLLLYVYHFADLKKYSSWFLMGAVWGLGTFARTEFAIWGLLLLYAILQQGRSGGGWRSLLQKTLAAGGGGLLFIVPSLMIRQILFGESGSTYAVQFDFSFLSKSYLMLWGPRNGLFVFWPVFALSVFGYFWRNGRNSSLYHVLFIIVLLETILFGSTLFWGSDLGYSFGQRRYLVVFPCLVLFLARFIDMAKKYFYWVVSLCVLCVVWANLVYAAYGLTWNFSDDVVGFLMPVHVVRIFAILKEHFPLFFEEMLNLLFVPKHDDVYWLFPIFSMALLMVWLIFRRFDRQRILMFVLATIVASACATTAFLAGAGRRGELAFHVAEANNPQARFIRRNFEIDYEILGSEVDAVAFFLELGDNRTARYHIERGAAFLNNEAPDQLQNFRQMCAGLLLRSSLGWERLAPEMNHTALLDWYQDALVDIRSNRSPVDIRWQFLY